MSPSDRWIVAAALAGLLLSVGGAVALTPAIQRERVDAQLTASDDIRDALPADVATLYMGLGAFRGIVVDMLWARMESMKQDGKFWEADQLARVVTKLQPRFPQVWAYHGWNLAYNISVATKTPDERWKWVNDGISVLRDEGIPLNPESVLLYKELGWIFLHKIGMFSDDMHWHYKARLAHEWHLLLGPPREGEAEKRDAAGAVVRDAQAKAVMEYAVIADMRLIAGMYERYLNRNRQTSAMARELERLMGDPMMVGYVEPLRPHAFERFKIKVRRLAGRLDRAEPAAAAKLAPLLKLVDEHERLSRVPPLRRLSEADPEVAAELAALAEMGYTLATDAVGVSEQERDFVREVGRLLARADSETMRMLGRVRDDRVMSARQMQLMDWLLDTERAEPRRRLLALLRAKVLRDQYHMDPMWMLELMEGGWFKSRSPERKKFILEESDTSIPVDWRHPAAHGLYWCSMGVRVSHGLLRPEDYDVLNTDRTVLHSLQGLTHTGRIVFDPESGFYEQMPDPRFIDAYHEAVFGAYERISKIKDEGTKDVGVAPQTFQSGHENFLIWATQSAYFWADTARAERYYRWLRQLYSGFEANRAERYAKPLEEFVFVEFIREEQYQTLDDARSAVLGMINRAIRLGLINGRGDVALTWLNQARRLHTAYQTKQDYKTNSGAAGDRNRMALPPFEEMVALAFGAVLNASPQEVATLMKSRAYNHAPDWMKLMVYDRVAARLALLCQQHDPPLEMARAFPPPPQLERYRAEQEALKKRRDQEADRPAPLIRK